MLAIFLFFFFFFFLFQLVSYLCVVYKYLTKAKKKLIFYPMLTNTSLYEAVIWYVSRLKSVTLVLSLYMSDIFFKINIRETISE